MIHDGMLFSVDADELVMPVRCSSAHCSTANDKPAAL